MTDLTLLSRRALDACATLAAHTEVPGEITRTFLCPPSRDVTAFLTAWAHELGLEVRVDAAGNLRARRAGPTPDAPTLYLGSHVDTVPNAGAFDGVLGVTLAYAVAEALRGEALRSSEGAIAPDGLRPRKFEDKRSGREMRHAEFDPAAATPTVSSAPRLKKPGSSRSTTW